MNIHDEWARVLLNPDLPVPAGLRTWNGSSPLSRYSIYRNNVMASLIDALGDSFPVIKSLVGDAFFKYMAGEFIRHFPPCSPVLNEFGFGFPTFIEQFSPAASFPYLADVAQLEVLYIKSFHAADDDFVPSEKLERFLSMPESLADATIKLHSSLHVIQSYYSIVSIWAAHQGDLNIESVNPLEFENAWVLRNNLTVEILLMSAGDCFFVTLLNKGKTLSDATQLAQEFDDFDLPRCLRILIEKKIMSDINLS